MNKTFLITGATSGIGKITALAVAKSSPNHTVIFNARNVTKGDLVRQELIEQSGNLNIFCFECDFASLASVTTFAKEVTKTFPIIDGLLNNAGTWEMTFSETQDGVETNFGVNHLAPFLLTHLLMPSLKASPSARIINTSSGAHRRDILQLDDLEFRNGEYNGFYSYSQSKLCNMLFSLELEKKLAKEGIHNVNVNSLHPGLVKTALFDKMSAEELSFFGNFVTPEEGAETSIFLCLSDNVDGISGGYWHKNREAERSPKSQDEVLAKKLWDASLPYVAPFLS